MRERVTGGLPLFELESMQRTRIDTSRLPLTMRLDELLSWRARRTGSQPAVVYDRAPFTAQAVTWRELDEQASRFARGLGARHVRSGAHVALVLEDSPSCLAALFAIWRRGAVVIPVDDRWPVGTAESILSHAQPVCIAGSGSERQGFDLHTHAVAPFVSFEELQSSRSGAECPGSGTGDDMAMIAYTSGTTTNPKGVMLRHRHLRHAYRIARNALFASPPQRFGHVFRTAGLGVLAMNYLMPLECGVPVVVMPELWLQTAQSFWHDVKRNAVGFVYLVPTLVQLLVRMAERVDEPSAVQCITGGAPLSERVHSQFQELFGHPLRNVYGLTEASFGFFWGADEADGRGAWHLGRPPFGVRVRLRNTHGKSGKRVSEGTLEVAGPFISDGYWRNHEATREVFVDGWLLTGDVARRDADGNYTVVGRMKDVVIRGGVSIHLDEIDQTLMLHPHVLSACAVGMRDDEQEEALGAVVQVKAGLSATPAELAAWCRARLGAAKTPRVILTTAGDLPRTSSGKVVRARVAQWLAEQTSLELGAAHV